MPRVKELENLKNTHNAQGEHATIDAMKALAESCEATVLTNWVAMRPSSGSVSVGTVLFDKPTVIK